MMNIIIMFVKCHSKHQVTCLRVMTSTVQNMIQEQYIVEGDQRAAESCQTDVIFVSFSLFMGWAPQSNCHYLGK